MIAESLQQIPAEASRLVVAYSGGLDSSVLLHLVSKHCRPRPVLAWHINHGLQPAADDMEDFCRDLTKALDIPLRVDRLQLDRDSGNLEARARKARYQLFEEQAEAGDCILTAHHQADQAETVLLNLFRGSGTRGLRGIAEHRSLGSTPLVRPLLGISKQQLTDYAREHGLQWFDDPSNTELDFNRNYLRQQIMPAVVERWPMAEQKIADGARWQVESQDLLDELAAMDLFACEVRSEWGAALSSDKLLQLSAARARNLLRYWLNQRGVELPALGRLDTLLTQLTGENSTAEITMPGYRLRSFDQRLFLLLEKDMPGSCKGYFEFRQQERVNLPGLQTPMSRQQVFKQLGINDRQQTLGVGFRETVADHLVSRHHLKNFFQSRRVPPWVRSSLPLVFIDEELSGYLL